MEQLIIHASFNNKILEESHLNDPYNFKADLHKIRTRTLVIWGDRDPNQHVSCTDTLKKGIADASVVIMKDCGHVPMVERPEETAIYFRNFLRNQLRERADYTD